MKSGLLSSETAQQALTKDSACPSLPVKYRITGFIVCFVVGLFLSLLSTCLFVFGSLKSPYKFAIVYTIGNILSLLSSFFLFGPCKQLKYMFKKTRIIATILVLFFMIFTLIFSLVIYDKNKGGHKIVIWILIICQYCATFWYIISYIPFARTIFKKCFKCLCDFDD